LIRWNPCGHICDWSRKPFTQRYRPFRDDDREVILRWYPVPYGTPVLPFPSVFLNNRWDDEPWKREGVGPVWPDDQPFASWTRPPLPAVPHICGTPDDFLLGGVLDEVSPPVQYTAQGLPTCCAAGGGLLVGGTGLFVQGGGVVVGGPELVLPSGGVELGGGTPVGSAGGVELGGTWAPEPPPGVDCETAGEIVLATEYERTIFATWDQWFFIDLAAGAYHITATNVDPEGSVEMFAWIGTCPSGLLALPLVHAGGSDCWGFSLASAATVWLQFHIDAGGADYVFEVETGAC